MSRKPNQSLNLLNTSMTAISLAAVLIVLSLAFPAHAALSAFVAERSGSVVNDNRHGDFNGDGIPDEVVTVLDGEGRDARIGIHIRLSNGAGFTDQQVTAVGVRDNYSLTIARPQAFRTDCGTYSEGCEATPITPEHDSLIVSLEGGTELLIHFDKGQFAQDFVASDEAQLRRTLRAYYALQP